MIDVIYPHGAKKTARQAITSFRPSTAHADLGPDFFDLVDAAEFPNHILRYRNNEWAHKVGLGDLTEAQWVDHFSRFVPLEGSFSRPLALRYHGHQFQVYNPELGDGRGFSFAQLYDDAGRLLDLGTKGSGQTPWSRGGDGRLTLKGGVREVIAARMLEALGVNTSKPFSLIETGEELHRGDEPSPTRSSVLVRLNHSHVRIGTFQRLAFLKDDAGIARLVEHCVVHYYPELADKDGDDRAAGFLESVVAAVAQTGAEWMAAGFVHGVLNTDNINITGESFDYGPWRFLPVYDPGFTAAYFDRTGLYAYGRQPDVLAWNLTRLAGCLLPLAEQGALEVALNTFWPIFREALGNAYARRLGLVPLSTEQNLKLVEALWNFLRASQAPYEQILFDWYGGEKHAERASTSPVGAVYESDDFQSVRRIMSQFDSCEGLRLDHDYFRRAVPCTMLIDQLEALWAPIVESDDWGAFESALADIEQMQDAYKTD